MVGICQTVISTTVFLSPASVRADPPGAGWELEFSDDFNGTALDANKWSTCYWWGPTGCTNSGNNELEWYQPDDVIVQNGILRLRAQKRGMNGYSYTSGMISSHDKYVFEHGYAEIRAKIPKGRGLWPAFWLLPQDRSWPPEIDVLEILGHDPYTVHTTVHYSTPTSRHEATPGYWAGSDFSAGYHTFAVEWNPQHIIWYVDGVERNRYEVAGNIPAKPMYLLANLAVGGNWPGSPDATTAFPGFFDIDYIKVWQNNSGASTSETSYQDE